MASIINADTSGGLKTTADTSGVLQLQSGGTTIATISSTGLAMNTGNITQSSTAAPLIYVGMSATQSISAGTQAVINFDTKTYDTANCFNTSTHRFTPNVAGYYQVNLVVYLSGASGANEIQSAIQKNGSDYMYPVDMTATNIWSSSGSTIVYCNGTTDYITAAFYCAATKTISNVWTFLSAALIRSA